jgi:hypothetical protein
MSVYRSFIFVYDIVEGKDSFFSRLHSDVIFNFYHCGMWLIGGAISGCRVIGFVGGCCSVGDDVVSALGSSDIISISIYNGQRRNSSQLHIPFESCRLEVGSEVIACFGDRNIGQEGSRIFSLIIKGYFIVSISSKLEIHGGFGMSSVVRRLTTGSWRLDGGIYDEILIL